MRHFLRLAEGSLLDILSAIGEMAERAFIELTYENRKLDP
jgi:hypothetical protein